MRNKSLRRCLIVIFAALSVALLLTDSTLLSGVRSKAARTARIPPQGTPKINAAPNFDIRQDKAGQEKILTRRESMTSEQKDQREANLKQSSGAQNAFADGSPSLRLVMSDTLNNPESVVSIEGGRFLTRPSNQPREKIVRDFLSAHASVYGLTPREVSQLKKTADYSNPAGNLSWVEFRQEINGVPVFQGELRAALSKNGELVGTVGRLVPALESEGKTAAGRLSAVTPQSAAEAVAAAAATIGMKVNAGDLVIKQSSSDGNTVIFEPGPFADEVKVELRYFPLEAGVVTQAWSMVLWQEGPAYYTLVDAENGGELLWRKNITNEQTQPATYVVYNDDSPAPLSPSNALPGSGIQGPAIPRTSFTLISELPAFDNLGWINDGVNTTTGNNVDAGLDIVAPNGIDVGGRPTGSPFRVFDFPYNPAPGIPPPGDSPTLANYRFGAVTDLFFWSNRYHDRLYELGFTEAALNFQLDNFGRGGLGNDFVRAEAQDFASTNNANFATPPDGSLPRMQMFIFTGPTPDRDGDLDHEIVIHELTHGTSNRLHANASGLSSTISGGMGEGWSDFYARALLATAGEDINGIYAAGGYATLQLGALGTDNYYYGIRRFPYAVKTTVGSNGRPHNPLTFADTDPAQINTTDGAFPENPLGFSANGAQQVHNLGEIWCMALLEVRARIINSLGFATGNQRAMQIVTDGMKLDPINPNFLQGRDAILTADCAGFAGQDEQQIWAGFATRGMGFSARYNAGTSVTEAFDTPNLTLGTVTITNESCPNGGFADPGESLTLNIPLTNPFCATPANGVTVSVDGGAPVAYGDIPAGTTTTRGIPFTVPTTAVCGSQLPVSVAITSSLGTVTRTFVLQIGQPTAILPPVIYSSGNIAVPIPDVSTVDIPIVVSDTGVVGDVNVRVRLNHTFDGDLVLRLVAPDGTEVPLATNRGGAGDNFGSGANDCSGTPTVFDDSAATAISAGTPPFAGSFRPESPLSALNGKGTNGTWRLRVSDTAALDTGTVGCVQLEIRRQLFFCCGVAGTPIMTADSSTLVNEACPPVNTFIDPGETVTVNLKVTNIGSGPTTNLVGTLVPSANVLAPSGPQTYGVVSPVQTVGRDFTFTANGTCGSSIPLTLQLQDGATNLGTVTFTVQLGSTLSNTTTFSNTGLITIPASGSGTATGAPANPYPSNITVSGVVGNVSKVTATVTGLSHTFPGDIDMLLVGPGGQKILLMSDVGGGTDAVNTTITFDDAGPAIGATIVSGTFSPTNIGTGDLLPAPAPAGPYPDPQQLSVFNGVNPNGTWRLFIVDDAAADVGTVASGWSLSITTTVPVCNTACAGAARIGVSSTLSCSGGNTVASVTISNTGTATANSVMLTVATLGGINGVPLPQSLGNIAPGGSVVTNVTFSGAPSGVQTLLIGGTHSTGSFSSNRKLNAPACGP